MSRSSKVICLVSLLALVLAVLFPPWNEKKDYTDGGHTMGRIRQGGSVYRWTKPAGFAFLFSPPLPCERNAGVGVAWDRLALEFVAIEGLAGIIILALGLRKRMKAPSTTGREAGDRFGSEEVHHT